MLKNDRKLCQKGAKREPEIIVFSIYLRKGEIEKQATHKHVQKRDAKNMHKEPTWGPISVPNLQKVRNNGVQALVRTNDAKRTVDPIDIHCKRRPFWAERAVGGGCGGKIGVEVDT